MHPGMKAGVAVFLCFFVGPLFSGDSRRSAKEALQPFNDLIGKWKGTGEPKGPGADKTDFWIETMDWQWQFKSDDAWLKVAFDKSRNFTSGELRAIPAKNEYQLTLKTPRKETITFSGTIKDRTAMFERQVKDEAHRLVFSLLHENRFLYRYEVRGSGKTLFTQQYRVGATKEGVAFASGDTKPQCIVSGGLGTMPVSYKGQTYYVCCGGCRTEFNENPEKYVKEFQERKSKKK